MPGYPFTPGLALAASLAFLVGSVVTDWGNSWKSLVLLAISYPDLPPGRGLEEAGGLTRGKWW